MAEEGKKLYRSEDDRWLAGVCGGIGEYFDIDPTVIRVLFILFAFAVGGGILIYIVLWIVMPLPKPAGLGDSMEMIVEEVAVGEDDLAAEEEMAVEEEMAAADEEEAEDSAGEDESE